MLRISRCALDDFSRDVRLRMDRRPSGCLGSRPAVRRTAPVAGVAETGPLAGGLVDEAVPAQAADSNFSGVSRVETAVSDLVGGRLPRVLWVPDAERAVGQH